MHDLAKKLAELFAVALELPAEPRVRRPLGRDVERAAVVWFTTEFAPLAVALVAPKVGLHLGAVE